MIEPSVTSCRHHLLIGGTGRAGTSFLVRYLTALGLDTYLMRHGEAGWDEDANAGLENLVLPGQAADELPYVVKSPWLHEQIDYILAHRPFHIDGVIVPIRPLAEAAASRSVLEYQAMHRSMPWQAEFDATWETWGRTNGGTVYSLNPLDQGRLLAVGLHKLLECLVSADIPVVLLAFPRLTEDADYLFAKLRRFLPAVDAEAARAAHSTAADSTKVRITREIASAGTAMPVLRHQAPAQADGIAIRRELTRTRAMLADQKAEATNLRTELTGRKAEREKLLAEINDLHHMVTERDSRIAQLIRDTQMQLAQYEANSTACERRIEIAAKRFYEELNSMRHSRSWRLTQPYRMLGAVLKQMRWRFGTIFGQWLT